MQYRLPSQQKKSPAFITASVVAALVLGVGIVNILSAWVGIPHHLGIVFSLLGRFQLPGEVKHGSRTLTALAGLLLMMLSLSLFRRKRKGWIAAIALLSLSAVLHLIKGPDIVESGLSLMTVIVLLATRRQFVVLSDPRSFLSAGVVCGLTVFGTLLYGVMGFVLLHKHFTPRVTFSRAMQSTVAVITQLQSPVLQPVIVTPTPPRAPRIRLWSSPRHLNFRLWPARRHATRARPVAPRKPKPDVNAVWFTDSLVFISFFGVLSIATTLLRPMAASLHWQDHDREEVRRLLWVYGGPPLAYWTLIPGLQYYFTPNHDAVIAFRLVRGVALVLGDPLGNPDAIPEVVERFAEHCHIHDWRPAWYQITGQWLSLLRGHGWKAMKIGEDALVDLPALKFVGKQWQDVRTAFNRLPKVIPPSGTIWRTIPPAGWGNWTRFPARGWRSTADKSWAFHSARGRWRTSSRANSAHCSC